MPGDNRWWEFSGWQAGVEAIDRLGLPCDVVLFANEAYLKPGPCFIDHLDNLALMADAYYNNRLVGRLDGIFGDHEVLGQRIEKWICTNCMYIPKYAVDELGSVVSVTGEADGFFEAAALGSMLVAAAEFHQDRCRDRAKFSLEVPLSGPGERRLLLVTDKSFVPAEAFPESNDRRQMSILLAEAAVEGGRFTAEPPAAGTWATPSFGFQAAADGPAGRLRLGFYLRPDIFADIYDKKITLKVIDLDRVFRPEAPISRDYRDHLIRWLFGAWHSRLDPAAPNLELLKAKVGAILNEALLTARLSRIGCTPAHHGGPRLY